MDDKTWERMEEDMDEQSEKTAKSLSTTTRLQLVERDTRNLSRMMTAVMETLKTQGKTVQDIEEWQLNVMLDRVRTEEQQKALLTRLDTMTVSFNAGVDSVKEDLGAMRKTWTGILWIAATPVVGAVVIAILTLTFGKGLPIP